MGDLGIEELNSRIRNSRIPESLNWLLLGSRRKASGGSEFAVALPGTDLAWGLAEPQHRAFGVELHLLQHRFLIPLLSALIHHGLQDEEWSIF